MDYKNTKVAIHIGLHKTGTTYLQNYVFPFLDNVCFARGYTELRKVLRHNKSSLLISDERISGNPFIGDYLEQFYNYMGNVKSQYANPLIILGVRHPLSWLHSAYMQYLKNGGVNNISYLFSPDHNAGALLKIEDLLFYNRIIYLKENFSNVIIYSQEMLKDNEALLIREISKYLGNIVLNKKVQVIDKRKANVSLSEMRQVATLKRLNSINNKSIILNKIMHSRVFKKLKLQPFDLAKNKTVSEVLQVAKFSFEVYPDAIIDAFDQDWNLCKKHIIRE